MPNRPATIDADRELVEANAPARLGSGVGQPMGPDGDERAGARRPRSTGPDVSSPGASDASTNDANVTVWAT